jgi:hypothetical protein
MVTFGAVREKTFTLLEPGEYCLTLSELDVVDGQWGQRMVWKFLVSPTDDYANYIANDNGDERMLWAFTDIDIILGSIAHEFVEKMTGKKFGQDTEPPDEDDLLGKRVVGYIRHVTPTTGKSAGKKREEIVAGTIKPFKGPHKKVVNVGTPAEAAAGAAEAVAERAELIAETKKQIRKATILDIEAAGAWAEINLDTMTTDELRDGLQAIKDAIEASA